MALDPEEMKRRRQLRAQQRQEKNIRNKALFLRLGIAGAVLLAAGILILVLGDGSGNPSVPENTSPSPEGTAGITGEVTTDTTAPPLPETTTIHLAITGDLNITDQVVASGGSLYDYSQTFLDVGPVLAHADLSIVNLEGNLCGAPYGSSSRSAPQNLLTALNRTGVDMVQLANSYSVYNGMSGLQSTIQAVRAAGMEPLGVYEDQNAFRAGKGYTICQIQGVKVALIAFTKGMDGMALPAGSENCVNVLYTDYDSVYQNVDTEKITQILGNAAKENPDVTVVLLHWGSEFNDTISSSQEKILKLLQQNGVDAIVGHHSHYVQQMVYDRAKGTFVAYSLGDFLGDAQRPGSEYSVILDLEITKEHASGTTKVTGYSYTPVFTVAEKDKLLRVVRLTEAMAAYEARFMERVSEESYRKMVYAKSRIESRIAGE